MNGINTRHSDVSSERQAKSPFAYEQANQKSQYFRKKLKETLNDHIDYAKYSKKIIGNDTLEDIQKEVEVGAHGKRNHRKTQSCEGESKSDVVQIKESLQGKIFSLEKLSTLVRTACKYIDGVDCPDNHERKDFKLNASKILNTILGILEKESYSVNSLMTLVEASYKNHLQEIAAIKTQLSERYQDELDSLTEKFENQLQAKELSFRKHDTKLQEALNARIESLQSLLSESDTQILEKLDLINQQSSDIQALKGYIKQQAEELEKTYKEKEELQAFIQFEKNSYEDQLNKLNEDILRNKLIYEEAEHSSRNEISQLKSIVESSKIQLSQALEELSRCENQLSYRQSYHKQRESFVKEIENQVKERENFMKERETKAKEREKGIEFQNYELREEVKRLDRIVMRLKEELDYCGKALDNERIKEANIEEEALQLGNIIEKLELENSRLILGNKELSIANQQLELKLYKLKESKALSITKSEKKVKKHK